MEATGRELEHFRIRNLLSARLNSFENQLIEASHAKQQVCTCHMRRNFPSKNVAKQKQTGIP